MSKLQKNRFGYYEKLGATEKFKKLRRQNRYDLIGLYTWLGLMILVIIVVLFFSP